MIITTWSWVSWHSCPASLRICAAWPRLSLQRSQAEFLNCASVWTGAGPWESGAGVVRVAVALGSAGREVHDGEQAVEAAAGDGELNTRDAVTRTCDLR